MRSRQGPRVAATRETGPRGGVVEERVGACHHQQVEVDIAERSPRDGRLPRRETDRADDARLLELGERRIATADGAAIARFEVRMHLGVYIVDDDRVEMVHP